MDIDYLIDRLEALIQTGKRVPLSNKVMIDEQECYALIDQMRAVVPEEIKAAKRTLNDRERILDEADETARQIIEQAEQERRMMLEREGLLAEAERQRDIILAEAAQESYEVRSQGQALYDDTVTQTQEMRDGANQYAQQVLQELDGLLDKHLTVVRNGLQNFIQQSQTYQEQIEDYQQQYRPNYNLQQKPPSPAAPVKPAPPISRPTASGGDGSSQPPAARPVPARSLPSEPVVSKPAAPPPPPMTNPQRPTNTGSLSGGDGNRPANRLNLVQPSTIRPVPKTSAQPKPSQSEPDDYDAFDFDDEPPAPRQPGSGFRDSSQGPSNRPSRPPF